MIPPRLRRAARLLLVLALLRLAIEYAVEIAYLLRLPPTGYDGMFFWTVGRGIVNGLQPYTDLFETKPPGIFLLAAGSYWLTGSWSLGFLAHAFALVCIPSAVTWAVYRGSSIASRRWKAGLALVYSGLLGLYVERHAVGFIPEAFGVAALAVYLAALVSNAAPPFAFLSFAQPSSSR